MRLGQVAQMEANLYHVLDRDCAARAALQLSLENGGLSARGRGLPVRRPARRRCCRGRGRSQSCPPAPPTRLCSNRRLDVAIVAVPASELADAVAHRRVRSIAGEPLQERGVGPGRRNVALLHAEIVARDGLPDLGLDLIRWSR
jgi:hypothetical protein